MADLGDVRTRYRRPTVEERADHVEALALLARLVGELRDGLAVRRAFYVMTVPPAER